MKRKFFLALYYGFAYYLPDSYLPMIGKISNAVRVWCCKNIFRRSGRIVTVNRHVWFGNGAELEIGDNSGFGANTRVPNNIVIGNDVMLAPDLLVFKANHCYSDIERPVGEQGVVPTPPVRFGNNLWIGQRVIITPGRVIADGTIVAAGSVVTKDFPPYSVIGGNPARIIKNRLE